jgi:hypothetical protein
MVVNKQADGKIHKLPVHRNQSYSLVGVIEESDGIEGLVSSGSAPLEIIQTIENVGVNNCDFAFGEADFAVGLAELVFAIPKHRPSADTVKPIRNTDS